MKKYCYVLLAIIGLAACKENKPETTGTPDSSAKENAMIAPPASDKPVNGVGNWKAAIEPGVGNKGGRLVVTGTVTVKEGDVTLTRKSGKGKATPGELVLSLSREPAATGGKPSPVRYEELITRNDKYNKIRISYTDKPVAIINNIEGSAPSR